MEQKSEVEKKLLAYLERTLDVVSIDCVVFGFHVGELKVLLLRWKGTDSWSLPGGRINKEESVNNAADRILQERTGLEKVFLQQFYTFGEANRNKNYSGIETFKKLEKTFGENFFDINLFTRSVSVGYLALVEFDQVLATPDWYTEECSWWEISAIPLLLFDHNEMIELALKTLRRQLTYQPIGYNLLPEKFTMPELQKLYETILGKELDRRNFQKRMLSYSFLEKLDEKRIGGAYKSPFLYRFNKVHYEKALEEGISFAM